MATRYLLIDYENVHPENLVCVPAKQFRVILFVGADQHKLLTGLMTSLQEVAADFKIIQISGSGPNALDFHIAFYLGQKTTEEPEASFVVVSKDAGFDPLIRHLKTLKIATRRVPDLQAISATKAQRHASPPSRKLDARLEKVLENLRSRGKAKPGTIKTLCSTINALFDQKVSPADQMGLVQQLQDGGFITLQDNRVAYRM